jgi:hypothetical protein
MPYEMKQVTESVNILMFFSDWNFEYLFIKQYTVI